MHIHYLQAVKPSGLRTNKDTNGGYGTVNDFGRGVVPRLLKYLKRGTMNYPELLPAYVIATLKRKGNKVTYGQNTIDPGAQIVLVQTSIVNYSEELRWAEEVIPVGSTARS